MEHIIGFQNVIGMSLLLGATSYCIGLAPLSIPLSKKQLSVLSNLGTGLLVGTALGVILPEGIEERVANPVQEGGTYSFRIGIPILLGFALMFLLEEYTTSHEQPLPVAHTATALREAPPIFDVELEERGRLSNADGPSSGVRRAYPLSVGLIIHALVDGYALGVSAANTHSPNLSLVVFFAIIIHKAPTALALTTALLAKSLSVADCKKQLLYFSLATPVSSVLSYALYAIHSENQSTWSGGALLFSGGTFLYVASVVQPISGHASEPVSTGEIGKTVRTMLLVGGMFFPVLISRMVGHGY